MEDVPVPFWANLDEGSIVHYVLPDGPSKGEHRPAIVVRIWRRGGGAIPDDGLSNLVVFMDGTNDGTQHATCILWATSVVYSNEHLPRTWHWPYE